MSTEIRLIPEFTGQPLIIEQSDLKLRSGYLVYTSSFGGNLVDEFTVRDFLDNSNNEQLAIEFFNYLQNNFTKPEFNELYYNNLKLSNVLNDYYDKTVRSNLQPTNTVADIQLLSTSAVTYENTNFLNYNNRSNDLITAVIGYNTGDSYYVNVSISKTFSILENQNYDKYRKDSIGQLITKEETEKFRYVDNKNKSIDLLKKKNKTSPQYFIQSFVDVNFNDNESEFWTNPSTSTLSPTSTLLNNAVLVDFAKNVIKQNSAKKL